MELCNKILLAMQDLEIWMDLCDQWMLGCAEWSEAAVLVANRRYQHVLDKLQGLVIAWCGSAVCTPHRVPYRVESSYLVSTA
jgi:hypothetical protein